jgi:hypothetical protein
MICYVVGMVLASDLVTFTVPRATLREVTRLTEETKDRMHELLEFNTDGKLTVAERSELEWLVQIAQLNEIMAMALRESA